MFPRKTMVVLVVREDVLVKGRSTAFRNTSSVTARTTARVEQTRILTTAVSLCTVMYFVIVMTKIHFIHSFIYPQNSKINAQHNTGG